MTLLLFLSLWMAANAGPAPCPPPGGATAAAACKCGYPTVRDAYAQAQAVFSGVVVEVQDISQATRTEVAGPDSVGNFIVTTEVAWEQAVTLRVTRGWKGAQPGEVVTVRDGFTCGVGFRMGEEYLVYALAYEDGALRTSPCQRTRLISPAGGNSDFQLPSTREDVAVLDSIARARHP